MNKLWSVLKKEKLLPVVTIQDPEHAAGLAEALLEGGISSMEITLRTEAALEAIRSVAEQFPEMQLGAGTVLNGAQAEEAIAAGARFLVSPGFSKAVAEVCEKRAIAYIPGCVTATEIMEALECKIRVLKFFPAKQSGGTEALKTFAAVFPEAVFIPTGGINSENVKQYLAQGNVLACGGSWLIQEGSVGREGKSIVSEEIRKIQSEGRARQEE